MNKSILSKTLAVLMSAIFIFSAMPITASAADKTFNVGTSAALNAAVSEINDATETSNYTINLTNSITTYGFSLDNSKTTTTILGNGNTLTKDSTQHGSLINVTNGATVSLGNNSNTDTLTLKGIKGLDINGCGINNDEPGLLNIDNRGVVNMYNGTTIKENYGNNYYGGGVLVVNRSTFNMYGGTIDDCGIYGGSVCYGGGVAVVNNSTFNMSGGTISNCKAVTDQTRSPGSDGMGTPGIGGGIYIGRCSALNMSGGNITNCNATAYGGGLAAQIYAYLNPYGDDWYYFMMGVFDSAIEITGGSVIDCEAENGAGVALVGYFRDNANGIGVSAAEPTIPTDGRKVNISNMIIKDCQSTGGGGGMHIIHIGRNFTSFSSLGYTFKGFVTNINNCTIQNNTAYQGGGINIESYWTRTMINGCSITGNKANEVGGGIATVDNKYPDGHTHIEDSVISNNIASYNDNEYEEYGLYGGGIYYGYSSNAANCSRVYLKGANTIQGNRLVSNSGILNNVNVLSKSNPIYVDGALTGSKIGITDPKLRDDEKADSDASAVSEDYLSDGYDDNNDGVNPNKYFTSDHSTWTVDYSEAEDHENEVRLIKKTEPENTVYLTTKDSVDINFVIDADFYTSDPNAFIRVHYNHNPRTYERDFYEEDVKISELEKTDDGRYKFTIESAPAQLTEAITITLYDTLDPTDEKLYDVNYSMWQYCKDIMNKSISIQETSSLYDPEVVAEWTKAGELCKALIDYATAAQVYFEYNEEDMASKDVAEEETYYSDDKTNEIYYHDVAGITKERVMTDTSPVASISGDFPIVKTSLMSLAKTEVRFYYEEELDEKDYELSVTTDSGWYGSARPTAAFGTARSGKFIVVGGIESVNLDNPFTLTIRNKNTNETTTIRYSALAYSYTVLRACDDSSDTKEKQLSTLVKSVFLYNKYAQEYFDPKD